MSGIPETTTAGTLPCPIDPADAMTAFWGPCLEGMNRQALAWMDVLKTVGDPLAFRARWLEAVGSSLEAFMRTPAFLELMRRTLKAMTDTKALQSQVAGVLAEPFGLPRVEDISGLFERINSVERSILGNLKGIEARLGAVEDRLGDRAGAGS